MKKVTLYQKTRLGKIQQWSTWVVPSGKSGHPELWVEHGLTDGKKQTTFDIISSGVNQGKANETTPLQQAKLEMERRITKQKEHGYSEELNSTEQIKSMDFDNPMPKELCFYKPKNSVDVAKLDKLDKSGNAIYTVKRDGMMHVVRKTQKFGIEIYTRTMDLVTDKYPHLVESFNSLPDNSILLGEIILERNGKDDFNTVSSICRSDKDEALTKQNSVGKVCYYIFDIGYCDGQNLLTSKNYSQRRHILCNLFNEYSSGIFDKQYVCVAEVLNTNHSNALQIAKDRGLEGLVVWDGNGTIEQGSDYTFNGKAYRPNVLWKLKPKYELDAIARFDPDNGIGEFGRGKNNGKMKSVFLYQLDENGNEKYLCNCGGGFTDADREKFTNTSLYPRVFQIEYDSVQPVTGSLRFPVFLRDRDDKRIEECLLDDKIKEAMKENEDD